MRNLNAHRFGILVLGLGFFLANCTSNPQAPDTSSALKDTTASQKAQRDTLPKNDDQKPTQRPQLIFGIVPQQAPSKVLKNWQPFAEEMSKRTGLEWVIKTAPSIPEFEQRCLEGRYDVAYMNPYHYTIFSQKPGYRAFAKQKDKKIKGILVVRRDSTIKKISDLANKKATFPSPAAFAASVVTRTFLRNEKVPVEVTYANSHDSVYQNVAKGIQDVGGGVMRTWKAAPETVREQLRILWTSPTYTPHAFAFRDDLALEFKQKIEGAIKNLSDSPRIDSVYDPIRFNGITTANDADWNDVRALGIEELKHLLDK